MRADEKPNQNRSRTRPGVEGFTNRRSGSRASQCAANVIDTTSCSFCAACPRCKLGWVAGLGSTEEWGCSPGPRSSPAGIFRRSSSGSALAFGKAVPFSAPLVDPSAGVPCRTKVKQQRQCTMLADACPFSKCTIAPRRSVACRVERDLGGEWVGGAQNLQFSTNRPPTNSPNPLHRTRAAPHYATDLS